MAFIQSFSRPDRLAELALRGRRVLRLHIWFLAGIALYVAAGQVIPRLWGLEDFIRVSLYRETLPMLLILYLVCFVLGHLLYVLLWLRPANPGARILQDYRERFLTFERLAGAALMILLVQVLFSVFTSFKVMIPRFVPFSWDADFERWDRALHFGQAPWELLQPLIGTPWITEIVSFNYQVWFFVLNGLMFWMAFSLRDPRLRMQFFLTSLLIWSLLGNLLATLLSSAGPCYFPLVTGAPDPYVPLFDYLSAVSEQHYLPQLALQELLWNDYQAGGVLQARGISAMPSMHVASASLLLLLGWRLGRAAGWALTVFFGLILVGSVHLGWHYALDGYIAAPLTWLLWHLVGRLLDLDPLFRAEKAGKAAA